MVIIDLNLIKFQYYANTIKTMEIIATSKSNFKSKQLYHNVLQLSHSLYDFNKIECKK